MRETVNKPVDGMGKVGKLEVSGSGEKEILASGELEGIPTARKFRVVRLEGKRQVSRQIDFYNLTPALPANRQKIGFNREG